MWPRPADRDAALRAALLDRAYAARLRLRAHGDPASWPERDRLAGDAALAAARHQPPGRARAVTVARALLLGLELWPLALPELFGAAAPAAEAAGVAAPDTLGGLPANPWCGRPSRDDRAVSYEHL